MQAQNGKIPELKRVILATADKVVMADNLGAALIKLFGRDIVTRAGLTDLLVVTAPNGPPASGPTDETSGVPASVPADLSTSSLEELIGAANNHYVRSQERLRAGDWAGYGEEMAALQAVLEQMVAVTGVQLEAPAATPTPAATP